MGTVYLYGVVDSNQEGSLGVLGLDGGCPVHVVAHEGIGCVVSGYAGAEPAALPRETLLRYLLRHQQVVEHVMRRHTVLPVKFGTLVDGTGEVHTLLALGRAKLGSALASMRERVEIEVAATWDTARVLREVALEQEVVQAREAAGRGRPPAVAERLRLGQVVKACMDRRRDAYGQRMADFLQPLAVGMAPNPLLSDQMVMNVAFLVERARQGEFEERVRRLDDLFQREITFRMIGPLPPYSFSTVAVTRLAPERVAQAQQALRLHGPLSEAEARQAYRRQAAAAQRQRRHGDLQSPEQLSRLREAAEVLRHYCQAQELARSFTPPLHDSQSAGCLFAVGITGARGNEVRPARFGGGLAGVVPP